MLKFAITYIISGLNMKEKFIGFYDLKNADLEEIWNLPTTLYIFDTNVLLNLYSYAENTRNDFFNLIEKNILPLVWIPYHVGLEYQRRRLNTIKTEKKNFKEIENHLSKIESLIETDIKDNLKLNQRFPNLEKITEDLHANIKKEIDNYKKEIDKQEKKQPDINSGDIIRKKIEEIFNNKIGNKPLEQKWLDNIYKEGEKRYENKTPPGYMDKKDKVNLPKYTYSNLEYIPMYGDLIIWNQIIEKGKEDNIESIILVSDEMKEDWKYKLDSISCKKISIRAELKEEIFNKANIKNFTMLTTPEFMEFINTMTTSKVKEESISEVKKSFDIKVSDIPIITEEPELSLHDVVKKILKIQVDENEKKVKDSEYMMKIFQFQEEEKEKKLKEREKLFKFFNLNEIRKENND